LASGGRAPAFDGNGKRMPPASRSSVSVSTTAAFDPTGIVATTRSDFHLTVGGRTDAADFILAGKDGTIRAVPRGADAAAL
jgi:hypothetical protein